MVITSPESDDNNMGRKTLPPPPSRCTKETKGAATHYRARKYHVSRECPMAARGVSVAHGARTA